MTDIGRSIRDAQIFISQVGEECTRLATAVKIEISRALNADLTGRFQAAGQWTSQSSSFSPGNWVCQEITFSLPISCKGAEAIFGYLFFQISLSGGGTNAVDNAEPLVHIGCWQDAVKLPDYGFYLPLDVEGMTVTIDHGRLIHWHHKDYEDEWTYSVPLTSLNNPADLQRCVSAPIASLLREEDAGKALELAGAVQYQDLGEGSLKVVRCAIS